MITICKVGRLFISLGIIAFGIQQLAVLDFRTAIISGFPGWDHTMIAVPIITDLAMIITGVLISGIIKVGDNLKKKISFYLGFYFIVLIFVSHIPYLLFIYPYKLSHLGSWGDLLKELSFSGGAFIVAGSFLDNYKKNNLFTQCFKKSDSCRTYFFLRNSYFIRMH